jgi:hypothetical protein
VVGEPGQGRVLQQALRIRRIAIERAGDGQLRPALLWQHAHHQLRQRRCVNARAACPRPGPSVVHPDRCRQIFEHRPGGVETQARIDRVEEQLHRNVRKIARPQATAPDKPRPRHGAGKDAVIEPVEKRVRQDVGQVLVALRHRRVRQAREQFHLRTGHALAEGNVHGEQRLGLPLAALDTHRAALQAQALVVPVEIDVAPGPRVAHRLAVHGGEMHGEGRRIQLQATAAGTQFEESADAGQRRRPAPALYAHVIEQRPQGPARRRLCEVVEAQFQGPELPRGRQHRQHVAQPQGQARRRRQQRRQAIQAQALGADAQGTAPPVELGTRQVQDLVTALRVQVLRQQGPVIAPLRQRRFEGQVVEGQGPGAIALAQRQATAVQAHPRPRIAVAARQPELRAGATVDDHGPVECSPQRAKLPEVLAGDIDEHIAIPGQGFQGVAHAVRIQGGLQVRAVDACAKRPSVADPRQLQVRAQRMLDAGDADRHGVVEEGHALHARQEGFEPLLQAAATAVLEPFDDQRTLRVDARAQAQAAHFQLRHLQGARGQAGGHIEAQSARGHAHRRHALLRLFDQKILDAELGAEGLPVGAEAGDADRERQAFVEAADDPVLRRSDAAGEVVAEAHVDREQHHQRHQQAPQPVRKAVQPRARRGGLARCEVVSHGASPAARGPAPAAP